MNIVEMSYIYPKKINMRRGMFIHQQAKYFVRAGNEADFITTSSYGDRKEETMDGVKVHRVSSMDYWKPFAGILFIVNTIRELSRLNKEKNIDLVIGQFLGTVTIAVGIYLKFINKRFIVVSHCSKWELQDSNWLVRFLVTLSLYFPEKVICCSRKNKEILSRRINKSKLYVINHGMDPEQLVPSKSAGQFKRELGIGKKELVILTVGNFVSKKGIDVIINAIAKVSEKFPNIAHLIIGEGPDEDKLKSLVEELKLKDKVRFEGRKIKEELANYYNMADIFVLMSRDIHGEVEGLGIVHLEAAYFSKPVIGGKSGGTIDAVEHGKTGYIIDSKNQKELEKKLLLLLKNKKLRQKLGKAGRKRVLKDFLWEQNVKKVLELCKQ